MRYDWRLTDLLKYFILIISKTRSSKLISLRRINSYSVIAVNPIIYTITKSIRVKLPFGMYISSVTSMKKLLTDNTLLIELQIE